MDARPIVVGALLVLTALAAPVSAPQTLQASDPVSVTALAVARTDEGLVGVSAQVHATVLANGSGQVFVSTKPLAQTDMQGSARLAARVAAETLGYDWRDYDYFIVFESDSRVIGGPSAGGVMTLGVATALHNLEEPQDPWSLNERVAMTGTINPDGTIGPVGGIPTKAEAARDAGIDLFLYPAGQDQAARVHGGQTTRVHMPSYCADRLGITCESVASMRGVLRKAANVQLDPDPTPDPSTAEYERILKPRVEPELDRLRSRLDAARNQLNATDLTASQRRTVESSLDNAAERLRRGQDAFDTGRYYTTATMAFQGSIWVGHAENLTELHARDGSSQVVEEALATCQGAVDEARSLAYPLNASGIHEMYAIGAAQRRVAQAQNLLEDARSAFQSGRTLEEWAGALFDASFCAERSRTVSWWADLREPFGPGPDANVDQIAREVISLAEERVAYARAVVPQSDLGQAEEMLTQAQDARDHGRPAHAVIVGVEAQVEANVAVQTAGSGEVPGAVIEAAQNASSKAVAVARAQGVEPIGSVALFELSHDIDGNRSKLSFAWQSRSLAALTTDPEPDRRGYTFVGKPKALEATPLARDALLVGSATGFLAGALLTALAGVVWLQGRD